MSTDAQEPEAVIAARTAMHLEYTRGVYDAYYGPATLRYAAWLRLLERIHTYCDARTGEETSRLRERITELEAAAQADQAATVTSDTSAPLDETPTIEETAPPQHTAPRTTRRRTGK